MESNAIDLESFASHISTLQVFSAVFLLIGAWFAIKLLHWASEFAAARYARYRMQITGIFPVLRLMIWILAFYLILVDVFRPPQNTILALLASTGLAVGLAAQDVIRNVISGILILFEKPFRIGDMVKLGNDYGEVKSIGLRSVQIHTFDDSMVTVPNSTVTGAQVANSNSGELDEMVVVSFNVPASLDVGRVKALAMEAAISSPYVFLKKPVSVLVEDLFNRTFLTRCTVKAYVMDVRLERVFASDVIERIKQALSDQGLITDATVIAALTAQPGD